MDKKLENTRELNLEGMDNVNGGTELEANLFFKHLCEKYGVKTIIEVRKHWTPEEKEYFDRAHKRKVGEERLEPYPD